MSNNADRRVAGRRWGLLAAVLIVTLLVVALVVAMQWSKWTCGEPDGVWVEAAERCLGVP